MKVIANLWVVLSLCLSAGLWLAAPPVVAQDNGCRTFVTKHLSCVVGPGHSETKGSCSCGFCSGQGMSSCDDFIYDDCVYNYGGQYVTIDMYECEGSGSCSCGGY